MKTLNDKKQRTRANAWGRDVTTYHQDFEVEQEDVGRKRDHYLGQHHRSHTFSKEDVGRTIVVMSDDTGWTCWSFHSPARD